MKRWIAIVGAVLGVLVLALVCVPFFVPLRRAAYERTPQTSAPPAEEAAPPETREQAQPRPNPAPPPPPAPSANPADEESPLRAPRYWETNKERAQEMEKQQAEEARREAMERNEAEQVEGARQAEPASAAAPPAQPALEPGALSDLGKSHPGQHTRTRSYDFEEDMIEGDLARPDAQSSSTPQTKPITINEVTIVGDESIERYPNIEAPETVAMGQEIAVQVSLTKEQLAPETKILSGEQHEGKLQLHMAAGEDRWTLTVNLTAPGMEFTRGGNTSEMTVTRDGDSTLAIFYLRPAANALAAEPRRDTRILATLLHGGAFIARLSRPLTIVSAAGQSAPQRVAASLPADHPAAAEPSSAQPAAAASAPAAKPEIRFDPDIEAPDLTIVENRVGNTLRVVFFSPHSAPVEADIADADALHAWIQAHYAQMATSGRGFEQSGNAEAGTPQHAADYLNGFGDELYDRIAPQAFKTLFWKLMDNSYNHSPDNKRAKWPFEYIQVLSDDPAIPWELMRPARNDGADRLDFLGLHFSIARWPLGTRGAARPPQSITLSQSAVIAPVYRSAQQLPSAGAELATLRQMQGFTQVAGDYASVRTLAQHPPQGIVHFAGHGAVIDQNGAPQFAILLEDSTMDPATWQSLESASAATHPLFFFNACDVGESRRFLNDVDGWAPVLLSSGASGYIGALWPVNDAVAEAVAASFYRRLSSHIARFDANVAETLAKARAEVFTSTGNPTALAYVFYGDPDLIVTTTPSPDAR